MPIEIVIWDDNTRSVKTGPSYPPQPYKDFDPLPSELEGILLDIANGRYEDWRDFANDMAEDETVIERVLENKRKGF